MKSNGKPIRVYRGVNIPMEIDERLKAIAKRERRSVTRTVEILLESALERELPPESIQAKTDTAA